MDFNILKYIFGTSNERILKKYGKILQEINLFEKEIKKLNDQEIKNEFIKLKNNISDIYQLNNILSFVYALVREVAFRTLNMRHFDVQILGGIALYNNKIAEIATGEGKTLVATLPACLYSILNKSVHIITVNEYLAKRDAKWMAPIYNFLGVSVGIVNSEMTIKEKKIEYKKNVVYGTNSEFGFDYLRDNIVLSIEDKVQDELFFAIIDEVDSILIDEARTPLIISIPEKFNYKTVKIIDKITKRLKIKNEKNEKGHFLLEEKYKQIQITEFGFMYLEEIFKKFNILNKKTSLYDIENIELLHFVHASLKAHHFFKKDVDYIIKNNEILIIDEHTGRIMEGRRWSDGIHQAVEAKENLNIKSENHAIASITFQNYFRLYKNLSGMTGTANTESLEFYNIYGLEVVIIPTNKKCIRIDNPDIIFLSKKRKFEAILNDVKTCYYSERPVLIGTVSIEMSEMLSSLFNQNGIKHNVLNAKYHEKESQIICEAGKLKSVTIATNMAGRGTDIVLGGGSIFDKLEHEKVVDLGGLKVIGTERHEARRIDNQLRGRCGRQGDPGTTQFYLSLEDDLLRIFIGEKTKVLLEKLNINDSEAISNKLVSKSIENAQKKIEFHNFETRKNLLEFDDIINEQRKVVYKYRDYIISNHSLINIIFDIFKDVIQVFIENLETNYNNFYNTKKITNILNIEFGIIFEFKQEFIDKIFFIKIAFDLFYESYYFKKFKSNILNFSDLERNILLYILDMKWKDHLINIDYIKKGVYLRGYAQKDPKQEYKKESFLLFNDMLYNFKKEFIIFFLKSLTNFDENKNLEIKENFLEKKHTPKNLKIKRNEICFCGSKKKYKQCHGKI